jgi:hypothetical protein
MRHDIIIQLDNPNHAHEQLRRLFIEMQRATQEAGFEMDVWCFSLDTRQKAQSQASNAIDALEQRHQAQVRGINTMIKVLFGLSAQQHD